MAIDSPDREDRNERFLVFIRTSMLISVFVAISMVTLLLFWSTSYLYYNTLY